jgi:hypothetical protein
MIKAIRSKFLILFFLLTGYQTSLSGQPAELYINEFMASNVTFMLSDVYEEYADWIEIYNGGDNEVNLNGYYLTDNLADSAKYWIHHDIILAPGEYIVFWADGQDDYLHTNFKLGRKGEFIGIYDDQFNVIDSLSYGFQENDVSYGRRVDDLQTWVIYDVPTPGYQNHSEFVTGKSLTPEFSISGGYYSGSQTIYLSSPTPDAEIYYSLDGTPPNRKDSLYTSPITIDTTHAIRVRAYENSKLPSDILTQTYLIDEEINLPVVSIATDPMNFFDDSLGIYVIGTNGVPGYCSDVPHNTNMDWERPVNVELYDIHGNVEINQRAGIKIFGGCSRTRYPHKSLALYARGVYGKGSFDEQLFDQKPIYEFESFILRASGDDCISTLFRDALGQAVIVGETDIDWQAYRPSVVFLNGQYWGIYNIREKLTEHYPAGNYNIDSEEINIVRGSRGTGVQHGSSDDYLEMMDHIENMNMDADIMYQYINNKIDINNFIDYQITEIYYAQSDWPRGNIKFWRANSGKYDRWRWILYDLDGCFRSWRINHNTIELATDPWCNCTWPNPPYSTLLFRKLLENEDFKNEFIQRYAWHMNTTFQENRIIHIIDSMQENIAPEIPRHIEKWGGQIVPYPESWMRPIFTSVQEWEEYVDEMRYFANERRPYATEHVIHYFNLERDMMTLTVSSANPEAGILKINNQLIESNFHRGQYFKNVPFTVRAMSHLGYKFSHWEYTEGSRVTEKVRNAEMVIDNHVNINMVAHFEPVTEYDPCVIINEINYHSSPDFDPGDWIELFNNKNESVDLTGWTLKDDNDENIFIFPDGMDIRPYGYLVICEDVTTFRELFPEVEDPIGNTDFGLGNGGDAVRMFAPDGSLQDVVYFDDSDPWPIPPDGEGPTLELLHPDYDNQFAESWTFSTGHGSPGKSNQIDNNTENLLSQNYPNPVSNSTIIPYQLFTPGFVIIRIYDSYGRIVNIVVREQQEPSVYEVRFDIGDLDTGIYYYTMTVNNVFVDTKRMVVIR